MPVLEKNGLLIDYLEEGQGVPVILIHSSVSGNRQWKSLTGSLKDKYQVFAVNLMGYGKTTSWSGQRTLSLSDQAQLVLVLQEMVAQKVHFVGHSYGGSVALKAAMSFPEKTKSLILLEPNPFYLLRQNHRMEAYREPLKLSEMVQYHGSRQEWNRVAEIFADYWIGQGALNKMPENRRHAFIEGLKPNFYEWGSLEEESTLEDIQSLPVRTLLIYDPKTVRSILEISELLEVACPHWQFEKVTGAGHNAPLTHPEWINPMIRDFLDASFKEHDVEGNLI